MDVKKVAKSPVAYGETKISLKAARAIHALKTGTATEAQQKQALEWIIHDASGYAKETYVPGDPSAVTYLSGRRSVGLLLLYVLTTPVETFRQTGETDA